MSNQETRTNVEAEMGQGEFKPAPPRSEPEVKGGHKPGAKIAGADNTPEYHMEVLPAGTAPEESTFQPQTESDSHGKDAKYDAPESTPGGIEEKKKTHDEENAQR